MQIQNTQALKTYFDLMSANATARVYQAAIKSGLIDALGDGPRAVGELVESTGFQTRPVQLLLESLVALGLVDESDGRDDRDGHILRQERNEELYALAPAAQFLRGGYRNLGDEYWDHLPSFLRTGQPLSRMDRVEESETQYMRQAAALRWMMLPAATLVAEKLAAHGALEGSQRYLDVAAGSAVWSLSAASRNPHAKVTAADWSGVLAVAEQTADSLGMAERFTALPGNFFEQSLPAESYDVVFVANFVHLLDPESIERMFAKLYAATKPGGRLVVVDVFKGQAAGDVSRAMYQLGLELRTESGRTYDCDDILRVSRQVGFEDASFEPLPVVPFTMGMVVANRKLRCSGTRRNCVSADGVAHG